MRVLPAIALVLLAACRDRSIDPARAAALLTRVPVATANGLSGLAIDGDGALWTVAERAATAYRIRLDAALVPTVDAFPITGLARGLDLEGIAVLAPGRFAFGTEGQLAGAAQVLVAEQRGAAIAITQTIELPASAMGVAIGANHGAEGVCGAGTTILAGLEATGTLADARWAPVVWIEDGVVVRTHRLRLTTGTGKLSALECTIHGGGATVWAIERHFEVTRILQFEVTAAQQDLVPTVVLDLAPVLRGALNLEGLTRLPDGRFVAVVDNQWRTISGPNELVVFSTAASR